VKGEAQWIRDFRKKALKIFESKPMPTNWATKDLENIVFENIRYYLSKGQTPTRSWDDVPDDVKQTFERLGIPEKERKFLSGVEAQFDSEAAYSNVKEALSKEGSRCQSEASAAGLFPNQRGELRSVRANAHYCR
jgi:Fe-S cluster assembly protein SufB